MRKFLGSLVFACLAVVSVSAQNLPRPTGLVTDLAQVLPPYVENSLTQKIQSYRDSTGIELAVVTVRSLEGYEIKEFANRLFNRWGVGEKGKDNGVMLLLAPNEREIWIEVGYGLEDDLTDGQAGYILDRDAVPYLRDDNWSGGVIATVDGLLSHLGKNSYQARVAQKAELDLAEQEARKVQEEESRRNRAEFKAAMARFFSFAIPILSIIVVLGIIYFLRKRAKSLKELQRENDKEISAVTKRFESFKLRLDEAEKVFESLKDENIQSVRDSYFTMLGDIRDFCQACTVDTFPAICLLQLGYREADDAHKKTVELSGLLTEAEAKVSRIIGLPELIISKKQWVLDHRKRITDKVDEAKNQYELAGDRLDEDYETRIEPHVGRSSAKADDGVLAFSRSSDKEPDWIYLSNLFEEAENSANQVFLLLKEYSGLVAKAKAEKDNLILELDTVCRSGAQIVKHTDVRESTVLSWRPPVAEAHLIMLMSPYNDQEWVLFLAKATGSKKKLEEIVNQAKKDVLDAEEDRERARRRTQNARRSTISSSRAGSSGSGGSSFKGFGGGRSGGGGAGRKF